MGNGRWFCARRPNWYKVGATFSSNVHDFEKMKIRILNGGHQVIENATEIIAHVDFVENMAPNIYLKLIEERFSTLRL